MCSLSYYVASVPVDDVGTSVPVAGWELVHAIEVIVPALSPNHLLTLHLEARRQG